MITGAQIREARRLLNLEANALAKLPLGVITRAENVDHEPIITMAQARASSTPLRRSGPSSPTAISRASGSQGRRRRREKQNSRPLPLRLPPFPQKPIRSRDA